VFRLWTRRVGLIGAVGAAVALLAGASWLTTHDNWEGGFPAGAIRLTVRTTDGRPIPGAEFQVYRPDGGRPPDFSPFLDPGRPTDARGRLTVAQPHFGIMWGGERWRLFWVVPIGDRPGRPEIYYEVAAAGFRPVRVGVFDLFAAARPTAEQIRVSWPANAREVELPLYETEIVLEQQPPNPRRAPDGGGT
jgi:hypothetical protein